MLIVWTVSFLVSKLPFCEWLSEIAFTGVRKLSRAMSNLSKLEGDDSIHCWEGPFEFWWNFSIKYFVPFALSFLLFNSLKTDIDNPYNNYHMFWQSIGFAFLLPASLSSSSLSSSARRARKASKKSTLCSIPMTAWALAS